MPAALEIAAVLRTEPFVEVRKDVLNLIRFSAKQRITMEQAAQLPWTPARVFEVIETMVGDEELITWEVSDRHYLGEKARRPRP